MKRQVVFDKLCTHRMNEWRGWGNPAPEFFLYFGWWQEALVEWVCIRMNEDGRAFAGAAAHCHLNRKNLIVDGALYGWTVMRRERERQREREGRERFRRMFWEWLTRRAAIGQKPWGREVGREGKRERVHSLGRLTCRPKNMTIKYFRLGENLQPTLYNWVWRESVYERREINREEREAKRLISGVLNALLRLINGMNMSECHWVSEVVSETWSE